MADESQYHALLARLRAHARVYGFLRTLLRGMNQCVVETSRRIPQSLLRLGAPRGVFSEYSLLKSGQIRGDIILESQSSPQPSPTSLVKVAGLGQDGHQPWPVFWTHRENARLAGPTLALLDDQKRAASESMYDVHTPGDPSYNSIWRPKPVYLEGNWTSVISKWCSWAGSLNYYHWLMDGLPRLAALKHFPKDTKILVPDRLPSYAWDSLKAIGVAERVRPTIEQNLILENYYFSSPTAMTGCCNPYATNFLRTHCLTFAEQSFSGPRKIFVHRRKKTRGLVNEEEVLRIFERNGWASIDLEELSFSKQIKLFSEAEAVCGLHGAGFTNLLWCKPQASVTELFSGNFLNGCYENLAKTVGVDHRFLIFSSRPDFKISIDPKELSQIATRRVY